MCLEIEVSVLYLGGHSVTMTGYSSPKHQGQHSVEVSRLQFSSDWRQPKLKIKTALTKLLHFQNSLSVVECQLHYRKVKGQFTLSLHPPAGGQGNQHGSGIAGRAVCEAQRQAVPGSASAEGFRQEQPDPALADLLPGRA